nr:hypothetical protein [Ardenticatenales bacterium]
HEWDTNHSHLFVPNEAGPYELEIEMSEATVSSLRLIVTVKQGVWLSRYFIIFAVLAALMTYFFYAAGRGLSFPDMMEELEDD